MIITIIRGGREGGRPLNLDDPFERAVRDLFWPRGVMLHAFAERLWGTIVNRAWTHDGEHARIYTFRAAGDVIAAALGTGDYLDWCSCHSQRVGEHARDEEIVALLEAKGWRAIEITSTGVLCP